MQTFITKQMLKGNFTVATAQRLFVLYGTYTMEYIANGEEYIQIKFREVPHIITIKKGE